MLHKYLTFFYLVFLSGSAFAESSASLPPEYKEWATWVKDAHPEWDCARSTEAKTPRAFECVWPGQITVYLKPTGARFEILVELLAKGSLPLPGRAEMMPFDLALERLDLGSTDPQKNLIPGIFVQGGIPHLSLEKGKYSIAGLLSWSEKPRELSIPANYGLVKIIDSNNRVQDFSKRSGGTLWLDDQDTQVEEKSFFLTVFRQIKDGSPLLIDTLLRFQIAGTPRTVELGNVLPKGALPVSLSSPLTAQLTPAGTLTLQAHAGSYEVRIKAVMTQPVQEIALTAQNLEDQTSADWPEQEIWSWQESSRFRTVEISGAQALTAAFTDLPADWQTGAVYSVKTGSRVLLKELKRGLDRQEENQINQSRQLWLDLDGQGLTVQDTFTGRINSVFRLNALSDLQLGRAFSNEQDLPISKDFKTGELGIELRNQNLDLSAVSRLDSPRSFSASGWNHTTQSLNGELHLGPAWQLLHISGVYGVRGGELGSSWVDSWSLLDCFVLILITLASWKLFGLLIATLVFSISIINHGQFIEPRLMLIHLLLAWLIRVLTKEAAPNWRRASSVYLHATFLLWCAEVITFSKLQLTQLLYPQLQAGTRLRTVVQSLLVPVEQNLLVWPTTCLICGLLVVLILMLVRFKEFKTGIFASIVRLIFIGGAVFFLLSLLLGFFFSAGSYMAYRSPSTHLEQQAYQSDKYRAQSIDELDVKGARPAAELAKESILPTPRGPAKVNSYSNITVNNLEEVAAQEDQSRMLQAGPALPLWKWRTHQLSFSGPVRSNAEIRLYLLSPTQNRVLSGIRLILIIVLSLFLGRIVGYRVPRFAPKLALLILATFGLSFGGNVQADVPPDSFLKEIEKRLERQLCQRNECAAIEKLSLFLDNNHCLMSLSYLSEGISSLIIPGPLEHFSVDRVEQDGAPVTSLRMSDGGFLVVRTNPGRHELKIEVRPRTESIINLQFPQVPFHTTVTAVGWQVEGLEATGTIKGSLNLLPVVATGQLIKITETSLPSWFLIRRSITIGEQIAARTSVRRLGSLEKPTLIRFASLSGEKIVTDSVTLEQGEITARFAAGQSIVEFEGSIGKQSELSLLAGNSPNVSEEWNLSCSTLFHCSWDGLSPTELVDGGQYRVIWQPFPGEKTKIKAQALQSVGGSILTIDSASHQLSWGAGLLGGEVVVRLRNTGQTSFPFALTSEAELKQVTLDGNTGGVVSGNDNSNSVLLNPGSHELRLNYELPWQPQIIEHVPPVTLGAEAANVAVRVIPREDRWIIWTGGMFWGPAVLFWSKLFVIVLVVSTLSQLGIVGLSLIGSLFFALGIATIPTIFTPIPIIWLAVNRFRSDIVSWLKGRHRKLLLSTYVLLTLCSLSLFYLIVRLGLLITPPMLIVGNNSSYLSLNWFVDHSPTTLPMPWVVSLPIGYWRVIMLIWSTWMVIGLLAWLKDALEAFKLFFSTTAEANPEKSEG